MHKQRNRSIFCVALLVLSIGLFSCNVPRSAYFMDIPDSVSQKTLQSVQTSAPLVNPDDVLNITIQTLDPTANTVLNQGNLPINSGAITGSGQNLSQAAVAGYLVDRNGYIHLPYIGDALVKGLSTVQVRDLITQKMSVYFKDPAVNVRFANFKITVLGEVRNPTSFLIPNESPTLVDALGLAGDITIFGRRDNVMIIRSNQNGQKEIVRVNLDSSKTMESPYFYLRPNDVIYVEPTADRIQSVSAYRTRDIAIIGSALTLMTVIMARLIR